MSIETYLSASLSPRYFQPRVGLGSSLAGPWFYSSGSVAHFQLGDQPEQDGVLRYWIAAQTPGSPFRPQLHGMFEAQLAWVYVGVERRLRHEQADQVVSEQVHPQFLLDHRRRLATEHFHAEGGLDVAQVQLHVPAAPVQLGQRALSDPAMIEHRGDQDLPVDLHFSYGDLIWVRFVLRRCHPLGPRLRLRPAYEVIALTQRLTAAKGGNARAMLFKQHIDARGLQRRDQKVVAVEG